MNVVFHNTTKGVTAHFTVVLADGTETSPSPDAGPGGETTVPLAGYTIAEDDHLHGRAYPQGGTAFTSPAYVIYHEDGSDGDYSLAGDMADLTLNTTLASS